MGRQRPPVTHAPDSIGGNGCIQTDAVTVAPPSDEETLTGEALIERKKLAGAGRKEEAGTAFGSAWTEEARDELASLREELGRTKAARKFIEDHPAKAIGTENEAQARAAQIRASGVAYGPQPNS